MKFLRRMLASMFIALAAMMGFTQDATPLLPFIMTTVGGYAWGSNDFVFSVGHTAGFTMAIPGRDGWTYDADIFWDTNAAPADITTYNDADLSHAFATKSTNLVVVTGTFPTIYFNNGGSVTYMRYVYNMGNVGWKTLEKAFYGGNKIQDFWTNDWDGSLVTNLDYAFYGCSIATNFPPVNTCVLVTRLSNTWCNANAATNFPVVSNLMAVTTVHGAWQNGQAVRGGLPEINMLTNITSLANAYYGCYIYTNAFPAVSNLIGVTCLSNTWNTTAGSAYPYINSLTNVTDLLNTWYGCNNCYKEFPAVSNLINVKTLSGTWYNNASFTGEFPYVNSLIDVTNIVGTWQGAERCRIFPAVSNLLKVKSLSATWANCDWATNFPEVSALTGITTIAYAWTGAWSNQFFPEVSNLTNITNLTETWKECYSVVTLPVITSLVNVTSFAGTFKDCRKATNEVPYMWDTNAFPKVPGATSETFLNCTNMLNYNDVPKAYGGRIYTNNTNEFVTLWKHHQGINAILGKSGLTYDGKLRWASNSGAWKFNTYNHPSLSRNYIWWETNDYHWLTITGKFPTIYFNNDGPRTALLSVASFGDLGWSTMEGAFYGCNQVTNIAPLPMSLTNATSFISAWRGCTNLKYAATVSNFFSMVDIGGAWQDCAALTSSVNDIMGAVSLVNLTNSANAFNGCSGLTGSGMVFVTAAKHANYTEGTDPANSSYRTFYGCTNLLDWSLIPANYGGPAP